MYVNNFSFLETQLKLIIKVSGVLMCGSYKDKLTFKNLLP